MYRHEYKYLASGPILSMLEKRVFSVLSIDPHASSRGFYHIRSLYFDDMHNSCYRENEDGTQPREKFRVRVYDCDPSVISLELKRKEGGKTLKHSCPLSLDRLKVLMEGGIPALKADDGSLFRRFWTAMHTVSLRPAVIVAYDRVPYVWMQCGRVVPACNVRVTFDRNIRSSTAFSSFLSPSLASRPVLGLGSSLMEVKYDAFLPDFIYELLQCGSLGETTFSKYYLCRKLNMSGQKIA
ncbi:MAG: polyphosphate polymerase domain-containing protein [Treponema sp.]|nr:polyphosphate polymerase domain-containing protein [Treponema sp.]